MSPEEDCFLANLHRTYFNRLTIYARARLKNTDKAKDVVQDAFHDATRNIELLYNHENPLAWLTKSVKLKIQFENRTYQRYINRFISLEISNVDEPASDADPVEDAVEAREASTVWEKVDAALKPEELKFLKRYVFGRASHKQLAEEFGITVWHSQKKLERIRKKLKKIYPDW